VLFLPYDAVKASIDEATTTERQRRARSPCVICNRPCGMDSGHAHEIWSRSVRVLGPRSDVADVPVNELGLVNSDPG